jgi:chloramphenicol 3-O-phosphotransferase
MLGVVGDARAILVTGVYGTGKSTVIADIAGLLETGSEVYAAIDLDWLWWSNSPRSGPDDHGLLLRNLVSVVANDRAAGVDHFVLAGFVAEREVVDAIRVAIGMPLFVVRLTVPLTVIEARLGDAPDAGRANDLEVARVSLAREAGVGIEDAVVENDGPIRKTSIRVLEAAGWTLP